MQIDIMSIVKAGSKRVELEEETLRQELRQCYEDKEELISIWIRLVRKQGRRMPLEEIEDEVIDLSREFLDERRHRVRNKLSELMGGR